MTTSASVLFVAHGSPMFALEPGAERGLDHGAWVHSRYLFPAAEVPVVPLSIQHHDGPEHAYQVGQALAPLVEQGWLIVAFAASSRPAVAAASTPALPSASQAGWPSS